MASPDLASTVGRFHTNDLGVDVVAQWAARTALRTKATWLPAVRRQTRENAVRIREVVAKVEGTSLPVFPSQANMFPIDLAGTGIRPETIQEEMLIRDGVFVRSGGYVSPLFGHRFIRVSFSNPPSDIERFARSFPAAVARLRAPAARAA